MIAAGSTAGEDLLAGAVGFFFKLAGFAFERRRYLPQLLLRLRTVNGICQSPGLSCTRSDGLRCFAPHGVVNLGGGD